MHHRVDMLTVDFNDVKGAFGRSEAVHSAFAILLALILEAKLRTKFADATSVKKIAGYLFDSMFGEATS